MAKANLEGDFRRFLYFLPHTSQVKGLFPIEEETKMMECACTDGIPFDPRWSRETEKVLSALRKNLDFTVFDD
ncbi:hypothetical protein JW899_00235 [Candidatus Uhrbacteria bacterium]|nr:hypothetical protein [Candidatus Uhrbacteria bacterium]